MLTTLLHWWRASFLGFFSLFWIYILEPLLQVGAFVPSPTALAPLCSKPCRRVAMLVDWFWCFQKSVPLRPPSALAPIILPFSLKTTLPTFFFALLLHQTFSCSLQISLSPVQAFKILKLTLELFLLCFSFVFFLVCLLSIPWCCFWPAYVVRCVFLAVDCILDCLVHFSFWLKLTYTLTCSVQTMLV